MCVAVKRLPGVTQAQASWNRRTVEIRLGAGNRVTLAQIREAIRSRHLFPRQATVVMVGRLARSKAGLALELAELGLRYHLVDGTRRLSELAQLPDGSALRLRGRTPPPPDAGQEGQKNDPAVLSVDDILTD